ncbi:MAG: hypothetical protein ACUVXI_05070 [bacterium]
MYYIYSDWNIWFKHAPSIDGLVSAPYTQISNDATKLKNPDWGINVYRNVRHPGHEQRDSRYTVSAPVVVGTGYIDGISYPPGSKNYLIISSHSAANVPSIFQVEEP